MSIFVTGTVTVENEGLGGVTVKLSGTGESETLTDGNGQYAFTGLRAGNYTIEISGFDADDIAFGSTSSAATVAVGESKVVGFEGTYLRTSAVTGQVSVEGSPLSGVTVSLQGRGEDETVTTNGAGQFTFSELRSGDYAVGITNPNEDEYSFEVTSQTVTVAHGETATVPFDGTLLRTAGVVGTVTIEGTGLPGVTVTINAQGEELEEVTNATGYYAFSDLHAGEYTIGITGYDDDEYEFEATSQTVTVELQETATAPFDGIMLRTAGIEGTVTVEGHALPGVTVTISGGPKGEEHTRTTNDAGYYMVDRLHAGDYAVAISDFDANEYEFPAGTTTTITVALRKTETVAFQGDLLRTAGISGRVSVEGTGLDGIMVTLSGDADDSYETADGGQYAFTGLAAGDYLVAISGWDEVAYSFDTTEASLAVADDDDTPVIQNFVGTHTKTAKITGMLFIDEVDPDGMHTQGEPPFAITPEMMAALAAANIPGIPLLLQGPGVTDVEYGFARPDGSYAFDGLTAGSYRVLINVTDELAAALTLFGFRFSGEATGQVVQLAAGGRQTVSFPFRIVMQTIYVGAVMGTSDMATQTMVEGVKLTMYPTVEDADNGTNALGSQMTDETGMAKFDFPRAMDLGPGGQGMDHLVFVKAESGHDDLEVADNSHIEIQYASIARVSQAPAAARLLNTAVNFQLKVMSDADARNGNQPLSGWKVLVGDQLIGSGEGDDFEADTTMEDGMIGYATSVAITDMGDDATKDYTVKLDMDADGPPAYDAMQPDGGEKWKQSAALTHTHNALALPDDNDAEDNDLGAIYVTWTHQTLVIGVHREMDDVYGYARYESVVNGDHRPEARVARELSIELTTRSDRNRLETFKWDHDMNPMTDDEHPDIKFGADGLAMFRHVPANEELTIRFRAGANRVLVTNLQDIEAFGGDLDEGMTLGSFGDAGGGMPEVRICSASIAVVPGYESGTEDDHCSTFGYQWTTGEVSGNAGAGGLDVTLEAVTDKHDAADDETKSHPITGSYDFSPIQDATYMVEAHGNDDYKVTTPAQSKHVYHDEFADEEDEDKADSAWVGRRGQATANFRTTRLGLEVRGYVANVSHEHNNVVRGDETAEGLKLDIKAYSGRNSTTTGQPIPKGPVLGTADVQSDGSYKFENLDAGRYVVIAKNVAGEYEALQSGPTDNIGGPATSQEYAAITDEQMLTGKLPAWDYEKSKGIRVGTQSVVVGTGASAVTNRYHNFALLHADGTFSGRVREARGDAGNIAVELRRCETADPAKQDECIEELAYAPQSENTNTAGNWGFNPLREGYYTVNVAATNYLRAKWDATGINDDAANCGPDSDLPAGSTAATCDDYRTVRIIDDLRGKRAFNPGGETFYVYNSSLRGDDAMTTLSVRGVTTVGEAAEQLVATGLTIPGQIDTDGGTTAVNINATVDITYGSASVRVAAGVSGGASYKVINTTATPDATYTPVTSGSNPGATVPLLAHATGGTTGADARDNSITVMVTGENGYNDHDYTFTVKRTAPVGYDIAGSDVEVNGTAATGAIGTATASALQVATASPSTATASIRFELDELGSTPHTFCAQDVEVRRHNDNLLIDPSNETDGDTCENNQYTLSAAPDGTMYRVTIESEDGKTEDYYLNLSRGSGNKAPTVSSPIADQPVGVGASIAVNVANNFSDADNDALTFTAASDDETKATVEVSGSVVTITGVAEGTAGVMVTATDPDGATASDDFQVTVSAANHDPTVSNPIDDQPVGVGASINVNVANNFSDPDNDALTFTAVSDDETKATVAVSGSVLTITGVAVGTAGITVTATDPEGATTSDDFQVTVGAANHDPTVSGPIPDQTVEVGATTESIDLSSVFSDPDQDDLTFTAVSGDETKATVAVSGSMLTITGVAVGTAGITVTATDPEGATASDDFQVTVSAGNGGGANQDPEVDNAIPDQTVEVGATEDVDVATNFSDADGDPLTFTATSDDETKATAAVNGSVVTITGVGVGSANITVTADDGNGVDADFGVTVDATSPAVVVSIEEATVREGTEREYTVRLATQPVGGDVTVTLTVVAPSGATDTDVNHVTTSRTSLVFTEQNWSSARTVAIVVEDDVDEDSEVAEVTHAASGANYGSVDNAVITVTAEDNDVVAGAAIIAAASVEVVEGETDGAGLKVRLSGEPTGPVTVTATLARISHTGKPEASEGRVEAVTSVVNGVGAKKKPPAGVFGAAGKEIDGLKGPSLVSGRSGAVSVGWNKCSGAAGSYPGNRAWTRANAAAEGCAESMATLTRRTETMTRAAILRSLSRSVPAVARASWVP